MAQSHIYFQSEGSRNQRQFNVKLNVRLGYKEVAYLRGISAKIEHKHPLHPRQNALPKLSNPPGLLTLP